MPNTALGDECAATAMQLRESLNGSWTPPVRDDADDSVPGLAERKAARKYDVEPETIRRLAQRLWGRSLDAERDERVREDLAFQDEWPEMAEMFNPKVEAIPPRSLQAIRGHVTRELLSELEPKVEDVKRRRRAMQKEKRR